MVRTRSNAMPHYVEHREGATEIGKLSAEAIVGEYETAAKEIEGMVAQLIACVKYCETMTRDALFVIEEMKATAARYREEAKRVFLQIENCMLMTAEVRKTCIEFKEKIAVTPAMDDLTVAACCGGVCDRGVEPLSQEPTGPLAILMDVFIYWWRLVGRVFR